MGFLTDAEVNTVRHLWSCDIPVAEAIERMDFSDLQEESDRVRSIYKMLDYEFEQWIKEGGGEDDGISAFE